MTTIVKRKPGRPRVSDEPSADVHLTLPAREYDRLDQVARSRRVSIQTVIRRSIVLFIKDERSGGHL